MRFRMGKQLLVIPVCLGLAVVGFGGSAGDMSPASPQGCIEGGDGYVRTSLSGMLQHSINWENDGTNCGGRGTVSGMELVFERIIEWGDAQWGGAPEGGANLQLTFYIDGVGVGETGNGRATVRISGHALGGSFNTPADACTVSVTQNTALNGGGAGAIYRVEGTGWCESPAKARVGTDELIHISEFAFAGPVRSVE